MIIVWPKNWLCLRVIKVLVIGLARLEKLKKTCKRTLNMVRNIWIDLFQQQNDDRPFKLVPKTIKFQVPTSTFEMALLPIILCDF